MDYTKQAMWEAYNKKCFYCGENLAFKNIHSDHVIPQNLFEANDTATRVKYNLDANFNLNSIVNFVPSCQSCNSARKGKTEFEHGIPMWLHEVKSKKQGILDGTRKIKNRLAFDLPDEHKIFFVTSPDFMLSDLSLDKIRKTDIPLYKNLSFNPDLFPLHLTSPDDDNIKVPVSNLVQFEKYSKQGYYGYTTPEIALESACHACLYLFEQFETAVAVEIKYKFEEYYRSLPAQILHVLGPADDFDYKDYENIGEYIDAKDNISVEIVDSRVKILVQYEGSQEFYLMNEVLQADFTGNGNNESIIFIYYRSGGTFHYSYSIHAAYLNNKLILVDQA